MILRRPAAGTVLSVVAITMALGGTGYAAVKIGTAQLRNGAVTSAKIKDGQVRARDLATGAVTARTLAPQAVSAVKLAPGAVVGSKIARGAVDETKIAPASLTGASIKPASIPAAAVVPGSFVAGSGRLSGNEGTLPSGTTNYRMLSLGGIDILANCTSQKLQTIAEPFVHDLYVQDTVTFDNVAPRLGSGVLQIGGATATQAVSTSGIGVVRWLASWTDASGEHVRVAEIAYQPGPGGCHFTATGLAQS